MDRKMDVIAVCRDTAQILEYNGMHFVCGDIGDYHPAKAPHLVLSLHACDTATAVVLYHAYRLGAGVILSTPCCQHELAAQLRAPVTDNGIDQAAAEKFIKQSGAANVIMRYKPENLSVPSATENTDNQSAAAYASICELSDFSSDTGRALFAPILQQGLLAEKFAATCTDALRATWLESVGYDVVAVELIDPEETPKNLLLRAVKRTPAVPRRCAQARSQFVAMCAFLGIKPFLYRYLPKDRSDNPAESCILNEK